jgi:RND family efflux transporter MFP subunit
MKKFLVSLGVASVIVGSTVWWTQQHEAVNAENVVSETQAPLVSVSVQTKAASHTATRTVAVPGTVEADQSTTLRAGVAGFVARLPIQLGQYVSAGATIATLDDTTSSLDTVDGFKSGSYQQSQIDETIARKQYTQAKKTYQSDKTTANKTSRDIAKLNAEKALIDATQAADNHIIRAPFAGVVVEKLINQGEAVRVGDPIATVAQGSKKTLRFFVDPSDAAQMTLKQSATFVLQDGTEYQVSVIRIAPLPDTMTRKVLIEAGLPKEAVSVTIATLGTVKLTLTETVTASDTFFVPLEAVTTGQNESYIFTEADGVAHKRIAYDRQMLHKVQSGIAQRRQRRIAGAKQPLQAVGGEL